MRQSFWNFYLCAFIVIQLMYKFLTLQKESNSIGKWMQLWQIGKKKRQIVLTSLLSVLGARTLCAQIFIRHTLTPAQRDALGCWSDRSCPNGNLPFLSGFIDKVCPCPCDTWVLPGPTGLFSGVWLYNDRALIRAPNTRVPWITPRLAGIQIQWSNTQRDRGIPWRMRIPYFLVRAPKHCWFQWKVDSPAEKNGRLVEPTVLRPSGPVTICVCFHRRFQCMLIPRSFSNKTTSWNRYSASWLLFLPRVPRCDVLGAPSGECS